jgi:hypothetical protein
MAQGRAAPAPLTYGSGFRICSGPEVAMSETASQTSTRLAQLAGQAMGQPRKSKQTRMTGNMLPPASTALMDENEMFANSFDMAKLEFHSVSPSYRVVLEVDAASCDAFRTMPLEAARQCCIRLNDLCKF